MWGDSQAAKYVIHTRHVNDTSKKIIFKTQETTHVRCIFSQSTSADLPCLTRGHLLNAVSHKVVHTQLRDTAGTRSIQDM